MTVEFTQPPDKAKAAEMAQTLGYASLLNCFNTGKPAHIQLVLSISAGTPSVSQYCLDQIERRGLSLAAAAAETAEFFRLDAKLVREIFRADARIWQHTRSGNFLNEVIPLSESQFNYCLTVLPPVNHPTMFSSISANRPPKVVTFISGARRNCSTRRAKLFISPANDARPDRGDFYRSL